MKKSALATALCNLVAAVTAAVATTATFAQERPQPGPPDRPPEIPSADDPKPVTPPTDGRQVAVLDIELVYENGRVVQATLREAKRVNSIAPKVFARQGGEWEVTIHGNRETTFYVADPGYLEAETRDGSRNPFTYVPPDGTVSWNLVVPLYRNGNSLDVDSITITDVDSGNVILETRI